MQPSFHTRQFKAGNSAAVRIPADMAFPPKTELLVRREGNRIIVEPIEDTLESVPAMFAALGATHSAERPEFIEADRKWPV